MSMKNNNGRYGSADLEAEDDNILCEMIKNGSEAAFDILANRYSASINYKISSFSRIISAASDCDDLYQECLIVLFNAAKRFDSTKDTKFSTFASICIKNFLISHYRSQKKKIKANAIADGDMEERIRTEETGAGGDFFGISRSEFTTLENEVLSMYISGMRYREIAARLSVSVKSVDNAMTRAKKKIRSGQNETK